MKRLLTAIAALALALVAGAVLPASAGMIDDIRSRGSVRIGVSLGGEPIGFRDPQNNPVGYDVDVANRLAEKLGVPVELTDVSGDARISMLVSGQLDIVVANTSATLERAKTVDFSIPYGAIQAAVGAPRSLKIAGIEDLAGKTVAVTRGGPQDKIVTERAPQAKVVRFDDEAASITAGATGQADIVAITPPIIAAIAKRNPSREYEVKFILQSYQLGMAMRKGQPELMGWVNGWIRTNLANGKLNDIHVKHAGVPIPKEIVDGAN